MQLALDPRIYQIIFLSLLLVFGVFARDFGVTWSGLVGVLGVGVAVQLFWVFLGRARSDSVLSALISSLSVLLLCRARTPELLWLAIALAISSKYLLSVGGKHFVNPTNFGILATALITGGAWVSPGQWGSDLVVGAWIGVLGLVVVLRSARLDTAVFFLGTWAGLLGLRIWYLGQSFAVWRHQLSSGTLVVFAFFMITDPRSTPDDRRGRLFFAVSVAGLAYYLRFFQQVPAAPLWALFLLSPLTLLLDNFWRQPRFDWRDPHALHSVVSTASCPK